MRKTYLPLAFAMFMLVSNLSMAVVVTVIGPGGGATGGGNFDFAGTLAGNNWQILAPRPCLPLHGT